MRRLLFLSIPFFAYGCGGGGAGSSQDDVFEIRVEGGMPVPYGETRKVEVFRNNSVVSEATIDAKLGSPVTMDYDGSRTAVVPKSPYESFTINGFVGTKLVASREIPVSLDGTFTVDALCTRDGVPHRDVWVTTTNRVGPVKVTDQRFSKSIEFRPDVDGKLMMPVAQAVLQITVQESKSANNYTHYAINSGPWTPAGTSTRLDPIAPGSTMPMEIKVGYMP